MKDVDRPIPLSSMGEGMYRIWFSFAFPSQGGVENLIKWLQDLFDIS
jgi:hypothetical protein